MAAETVAVDLLVQCKSCGAHVPVTRPEQSAPCSNCLGKTDVDVWPRVLGGLAVDVRTMGRGVMTEKKVEEPGVSAEWKRGPDRPPCPRCAKPMQLSANGAQLTCAACNEQRTVEPASDWLRAVTGCATGVVVDPDDAEAPDPRNIAMRCTQCGSPLKTDGSKRMVDCPYCRVSNLLPEDVWRALHPPKKRRRFWIVCTWVQDPRRALPLHGGSAIGFLLALAAVGICSFIGLTFGTIPAFISHAIQHGFVGGRTSDKIDFMVYGITVAVCVLIGAIIAALLLLRNAKVTRKRQMIARPENEVLGRLGALQSQKVKIDLVAPTDPSRVLAIEDRAMTQEDYRQLGGEGAFVRAWYSPSTGENLIMDAPSGLAG